MLDPKCFDLFFDRTPFQIIRPNLIIAKVCQNKLNYTADICNDLSNHTEEETEVTKHVTDYEALYSTISFVPK